VTEPMQGEGAREPSPDDPIVVRDELDAARDAFPLEPDEVALCLLRLWRG
jgi:hypothetical protein